MSFIPWKRHLYKTHHSISFSTSAKAALNLNKMDASGMYENILIESTGVQLCSKTRPKTNPEVAFVSRSLYFSVLRNKFNNEKFIRHFGVTSQKLSKCFRQSLFLRKR